MQLRFQTLHTGEHYVSAEGWREARLDRCPNHPRGGCSLLSAPRERLTRARQPDVASDQGRRDARTEQTAGAERDRGSDAAFLTTRSKSVDSVNLGASFLVNRSRTFTRPAGRSPSPTVGPTRPGVALDEDREPVRDALGRSRSPASRPRSPVRSAPTAFATPAAVANTASLPGSARS